MDHQLMEIAKVDLKDGEELMDFVNQIRESLTQHGQQTNKSLFLHGIYKGFVIVKDRESGLLFKLEVGRDDQGTLKLGEATPVRQAFVPLSTQKTESETLVAVDGETLSVPAPQSDVVELLKSLSEAPAEVYKVPLRKQDKWDGLGLPK